MAPKLNEGYTGFTPPRNGIASWFGSWLYPMGKSGKFFAKYFSGREDPNPRPGQGTVANQILKPAVHPLAGDTVVNPNDPVGGMLPYRKNEQLVLNQKELDRKRRYQEFEDMDDYPEIGSAFDIYADDSTQTNLDGSNWIIQTDEEMIKEEVKNLFNDLNLDRFLWDIVRNTVKYGDCFLEIVVDTDNIKQGIQRIKILDPNYIYRIENEYGYLTDFVQEIPLKEKWTSFGNLSDNLQNAITIPLDKNQIVHFRLYDSDPTYYPYGKSIAATARGIYKSLKMMEDAMLIYRLTRAPEKRVFYIDTGQVPASKARQFLEKQKEVFKKEKYYDKNTGEISARYNPMAQDEDFFVAVNGKNSGTKIEPLQGGANLGEVDDVKYFRDKLLATLKVPKDYIVEKDQSPERKANLSQLDVKFARVIVRVQKCIEIGLEAIAKRHLMIKGFPALSVSKVKIKLPEPSDMAAKRQLDIDEQKARVVSAVKMMGIFPIKKIYKDYYQLTDSQIEEIKADLETEMNDPVFSMMGAGAMGGMGGGMGGMPGEEGGEAPPGEAGGQESDENTPPTQNEEVDYNELRQMLISSNASPEAISAITEIITESALIKNTDSEDSK